MNYYDDFYEGLNETRSLLYRQIDSVAAFNKLLSTLCCEIHNLENYKINLAGDIVLKEKISVLLEELCNYKIKLQHLIKIKNGFPIFQLNDIENISQIKTLPSIDYKKNTVIDNLNIELKTLIKLIDESINNAQKENDYQSLYILSKLLYKINETLLYITH